MFFCRQGASSRPKLEATTRLRVYGYWSTSNMRASTSVVNSTALGKIMADRAQDRDFVVHVGAENADRPDTWLSIAAQRRRLRVSHSLIVLDQPPRQPSTRVELLRALRALRRRDARRLRLAGAALCSASGMRRAWEPPDRPAHADSCSAARGTAACLPFVLDWLDLRSSSSAGSSSQTSSACAARRNAFGSERP